MRYAYITGVNGQDGSYLSELLLEKDYVVIGMIRRSSLFNTSRIDHLNSNKNFSLVYGDLTDASNILHCLQNIKKVMTPDDTLEIYNLAAQSHVQVSFEMPVYTAQTDAIGFLNVLEAVRILDLIPQTKVYQASTSEMFGKVQEVPQKETTPFYPRSPYGCAKLYAHFIAKNYRESYNMFISSSILFNHTSPRRGETFILRKITLGISKILSGKIEVLEIGNLNALRDIGHAKDYTRGMWMILQHHTPEDFVLATGEQYTIREFITKAFKIVGIDIVWEGSGLDEVGFDADTDKILVRVNPRYFRPCEVDSLLGDCTKAKTSLNWKPEYTIDSILTEMLSNDM
jgi:GDPmannose 4,6-dehydratase